MTTDFDADCEELLFELGKQRALQARELDQPDPGETSAVFAPLSAAESRMLVASALARTQPSAGAALPVGISPLQRRALLAFALAAAAGVALFDLPRELPNYELSRPRPDATSRDAVLESNQLGEESAEVAHYEVGRELRFVLRPARRVDLPVHASLFSKRGGPSALSFARVEPLAEGSVAITLATGPGGYAPEPGPDTLVFALWVGEAPSSADIEQGVSGNRLRLVCLPVVWAAP
ncbi:MAG TPA: hypothetical protein VFK05_11055 [Polyangiaceae bacterium]|nr:hypothetical protein [Polyangiaceae bacterium]